MTMDSHFYQVNVTWNQDRRGTMCSPELSAAANGAGCLEVATPPEFPKGIPGIWSPEHLFTAAVSSCLMTTFLAIAENSQLDFITFECKSRGKLEQLNGKFLMTEIILEPSLKIKRDQDRDHAESVLRRAESACLISNSIKSTVRMSPNITVETSTLL